MSLFLKLKIKILSPFYPQCHNRLAPSSSYHLQQHYKIHKDTHDGTFAFLSEAF
jgi:hypothetical protein